MEFNEAFASQTLACLDPWASTPERANLDGGALALGHAYGASGAVLVTRLLAQARRVRARDGVAGIGHDQHCRRHGNRGALQYEALHRMAEAPDGLLAGSSSVLGFAQPAGRQCFAGLAGDRPPW